MRRSREKIGAVFPALAGRGNIALTELRYVDAAGHFKQAAALVPSGHPDETSDYLHRQADALFREGNERGDNAALKQSIETWHLVLQQRPRERVPFDWAGTQNNLGTALETLGGRESGTARLEEAVTAYRAALEEWTRERVPLAWARTQNNLGLALEKLGERESGPARLEEAVTVYRAALEERTRERVPLAWAMTQMNLGNAKRWVCAAFRVTTCSRNGVLHWGGVDVQCTEGLLSVRGLLS
jgi:tetratricopeptide (TPR) repeat protein